MMKPWDAYKFLTHAALHCKFGSTPEDRQADKADIDAMNILYKLRLLIATETYEKRSN